jgi:hypothetical protein
MGAHVALGRGELALDAAREGGRVGAGALAARHLEEVLVARAAHAARKVRGALSCAAPARRLGRALLAPPSRATPARARTDVGAAGGAVGRRLRVAGVRLQRLRLRRVQLRRRALAASACAL